MNVRGSSVAHHPHNCACKDQAEQDQRQYFFGWGLQELFRGIKTAETHRASPDDFHCLKNIESRLARCVAGLLRVSLS